MRKRIGFVGGLLACLCEIVIGVLLLINPVGFTTVALSVLGVVLILVGISSIVSYFRTAAPAAALENSLANGILAILAGLFCALRSDWFIAAFPVLTTIYGVMVLVTGVEKVQRTVDLIRVKQKYWFLTAISAVLSLVVAVLVICNPFASAGVLWTFLAVCLMVEAVVDLIALVFGRK